MKYGNRRDANHVEIRNFYRGIGCVVHDTADAGGGFPDLVVGWRGTIYLIEVKDGSKPPSKQKLTADEQDFQKRWEGYEYHIVRDTDEALAAIGLEI